MKISEKNKERIENGIAVVLIIIFIIFAIFSIELFIERILMPGSDFIGIIDLIEFIQEIISDIWKQIRRMLRL